MLLTWSSGVIGLARLTVIGTVLPFSTSGGISSLTLPVLTSAEPTTLRMAEARIAGDAKGPMEKSSACGQVLVMHFSFHRAIRAALKERRQYPRSAPPTGSACRAMPARRGQVRPHDNRTA